jgi:hypothetical protein
MPPVETDYNAIGAVLRACSARDDPRFLARIAFGITNPRVTDMKLSKDPVFGSLNAHDFMVRFSNLLPILPTTNNCFNFFAILLGTRPHIHSSVQECPFSRLCNKNGCGPSAYKEGHCE